MQEKNQRNLGQKINSRDSFLDIIKGLLIILVLIGHTIQYANGSEYSGAGAFYQNPIFKYIYGFHMPLFMAISGYLFHYSINKKNSLEILLRKSQTLLIPIFTFAFIVYLYHFNPEYSLVDQVRNYLSKTRYTLWFLWASFYCAISTLLVNKLFKDNPIIYSILIFGSFLTPDIWFSELYKFMAPCFLFGYYSNKYNLISKLKKHPIATFSTSTILYLLLLVFYKTETYVYMSGSCIINEGIISLDQLLINIYRTITGIVGSISFTSTIFVIHKHTTRFSNLWNVFSKFGNITLGIYCFQTYFWFYYAGQIRQICESLFLNNILSFLLSLVSSTSLSILLSKNKITNLLFLGGR